MGRKDDIHIFIKKKIDYLSFLISSNQEKGVLADLRKGVGKVPGELPRVTGLVLTDMPESFMSSTGIPTKEEWACYITLTLFAWHQQGKGSTVMHKDGETGLGTAMRSLVNASNDSNAEMRIFKRLEAMATSPDIKGVFYHLRSIIQLLSRENIFLNYVKLAGDLFEWQFSERRSNVNLRWSQDFYRIKKEEDVVNV